MPYNPESSFEVSEFRLIIVSAASSCSQAAKKVSRLLVDDTSVAFPVREL